MKDVAKRVGPEFIVPKAVIRLRAKSLMSGKVETWRGFPLREERQKRAYLWVTPLALRYDSEAPQVTHRDEMDNIHLISAGELTWICHQVLPLITPPEGETVGQWTRNELLGGPGGVELIAKIAEKKIKNVNCYSNIWIARTATVRDYISLRLQSYPALIYNICPDLLACYIYLSISMHHYRFSMHHYRCWT